MLKTKKKNTRGISPVIATVLLIAMVIVIGLIVFSWFKGLTQEATTKFGGTNIELVCEDVVFSSSYDSDTGVLVISNSGNVPIYRFKVKTTGAGSFETLDLKEDLDSSWPNAGLKQGGVFSSVDLSSELGSAQRIDLIPVLLGTSKGKEKSHTCDERFGQRVI